MSLTLNPDPLSLARTAEVAEATRAYRKAFRVLVDRLEGDHKMHPEVANRMARETLRGAFDDATRHEAPRPKGNIEAALGIW